MLVPRGHMRSVIMGASGLVETDAERRDWRVNVGLNDKGLKEDGQHREKRKCRAPWPHCGRPHRFAASAPREHADVILYHSGLTQIPMKSVASGFDQ